MFVDYLPLMYTATLMTLGLAVCSLLLGLVLALIFVSLEMSKWQCVHKPSAIIITLLRGLPEILVVF